MKLAIKRILAIEKDPEQYLKRYVKDEAAIEAIRAVELKQDEKKRYKQGVFGYLNFDPDKLDLSDKIKIDLNRHGKLYKTLAQAKKEATEDVAPGSLGSHA